MSNWSIELWPGEITVNRDERQRKSIGDVSSLKESIALRGQLQPVVISRDNVLVAGERRFTAISELGDRAIRCVYTDELDKTELLALEFEENSKREDLTWKDKCNAILSYHELKSSTNADWTAKATAEALSMRGPEVSECMAVARELRAGNTLVTEAVKLSTAKGIVKRADERKKDAEVNKILAVAQAPRVPSIADAEKAPISAVLEDLVSGLKRTSGFILNEDFKFWAEHYTGPKFNFIHCDFPYGVGMHKSDQGSGDSYGTYEDTPEIYWGLIDTLLNNLDNFCDPSAHLLFWFSMDYYQDTLNLLSREFKVNPFPMIWVKSDNSGILPDPHRGPRRTYETAFLASRGDRKIVRPVSNHVASPIQRGQHMSEKPQAVLGHFFRMLVDSSSAVLDPTCGSGSAIRAAITAGASRYLGIEMNTEFASNADDTLVKFLEEKK